jgi:hypothetical protein
VPSIPDPLQLVTVGVYVVEAAALIASPGPKRGRTLVTWRHAAMLLVTAAAGLAVVWKINWFFLLALAVTSYPDVVQMVLGHRGKNLLRMPTPGHMVLLFLPPLLFACAAILSAAVPHRDRAVLSAGPDKSAPI